MSTNKQRGRQAKLSKLQRELGARVTDDPDGVLAVLQTARRLLHEGEELFKDGWQAPRRGKKPPMFSLDGALRRAVDLAHPVDRDRALWAAQHALVSAVGADEEFAPRAYISECDHRIVLVKFNNHPDTTWEDVLVTVDRAVKNQGTVNIAASKSKGRK